MIRGIAPRHDVDPKKVLCGAQGLCAWKMLLMLTKEARAHIPLEAATAISTLQTASSRALGQAETRASVPELDHTMFGMLP